MSALSSLHFTKKDDKSCLILMRLQSQFQEIGIDLLDRPSDIAPTALAFLLEMLEKNKLSTALTQQLQQDLSLDESSRNYDGTLLSSYFINLPTVMKYVKSATIVQLQEEILFYETVANFGLSLEEEEVLWENIFQKTTHSFYKPSEADFEDLEELPPYCGNLNILQNLAALETFLSAEQIDKIWPCIEFELVFNENYLQGIEKLPSTESTLDAFIWHWLEKN